MNNKIIGCLLLMIIGLIVSCHSKLDVNQELLIIVTPPKNFNPKDTLHVFGDFNQWSLDGDNAYKLNYENGELKVKIPVKKDNFSFFVIKNKSQFAASEKAKIHPGYIYQSSSKEKEMKITIPLWSGDKPIKEVTHTLAGNMEYIKGLKMPQLNREGDISIYLPPTYNAETSKSYPVLYMLDGQNVFDEFTSYNAEWKIDEIMEQLISENKIQEVIVVAVSNGERRFNEYMPWDYVNKFVGDDTKLTKGEGEETMQFIVKTLKPLIDKKYRTKTDVKHTGFAGSSLGGIMALYAGINHHDTFGFVGAFSPSMELLNDKKEDVLHKAINQSDYLGNSKIYLDMGKMEFKEYECIDALEEVLLENGIKRNKLKLVKDDMGRHCEEDWSKRFPIAIQWMLKDLQ